MELKSLYFTFLLGLFLSQVTYAQDGLGYQLNTEYKNTDAVIETSHKKSVIELFSYFCPHCYHLEEPLEKWLAHKPKDIHFEQVPAVFNNPRWIFFARVFYTEKALGILKKSHLAYFNALHRDHKDLFSLKHIAKFFSQYGVTEKQFINMFKSFKVDQDVKKAAAITKSSGIDGVPAMVVNGHYRTDVGMAGSTQKLWPLLEFLTHK